MDVFALSIAVGIANLAWGSRLRLGLAFAISEVLMQGIGYFVGTGAGHIIGIVAIYAGFAILAGVGLFIVRESFQADHAIRVDSGLGLLAASAAISLDSLGIGISLPGVPLPLLPLLGTIAVSTVLFTAVGLAFGARLGVKTKRGAERTAGFVLIVLRRILHDPAHRGLVA